MPAALVHIGTHKTGTKSFQRWANDNRAALFERHQVHVFRGLFIESNLALALLCTRSDRNTPALVANPDTRLPECRAVMEEHVATEVANEAPVLLASAEDLSLLRHPDEVESLVELLAPREIRVSVCLRDPDEFLRAYRSQMDRLGQHASTYPSSHTYYGPDTWLTHWDEMLATWRQVLGDDRVTSFDYKDAMAAHGSSIPGVLSSLGLRVDEMPSWRGYRENVTAVEEYRATFGMPRRARLRAAVASTPPGRALRRALRPK
jgi:hypothetical protein